MVDDMVQHQSATTICNRCALSQHSEQHLVVRQLRLLLQRNHQRQTQLLSEAVADVDRLQRKEAEQRQKMATKAEEAGFLHGAGAGTDTPGRTVPGKATRTARGGDGMDEQPRVGTLANSEHHFELVLPFSDWK